MCLIKLIDVVRLFSLQLPRRSDRQVLFIGRLAAPSISAALCSSLVYLASFPFRAGYASVPVIRVYWFSIKKDADRPSVRRRKVILRCSMGMRCLGVVLFALHQFEYRQSGGVFLRHIENAAKVKTGGIDSPSTCCCQQQHCWVLHNSPHMDADRSNGNPTRCVRLLLRGYSCRTFSIHSDGLRSWSSTYRFHGCWSFLGGFYSLIWL